MDKPLLSCQRSYPRQLTNTIGLEPLRLNEDWKAEKNVITQEQLKPPWTHFTCLEEENSVPAQCNQSVFPLPPWASEGVFPPSTQLT